MRPPRGRLPRAGLIDLTAPLRVTTPIGISALIGVIGCAEAHAPRGPVELRFAATSAPTTYVVTYEQDVAWGEGRVETRSDGVLTAAGKDSSIKQVTRVSIRRGGAPEAAAPAGREDR